MAPAAGENFALASENRRIFFGGYCDFVSIVVYYIMSESVRGGEKRLFYARYAKRAIDVVLAILLLIALAIPMLMIAALIRLDSRGRVLFCQKRLGLHEQPFTIYKFRTMRVDAPSEMPTRMLTGSAHYITRVGKYLRISSLDELPQLFNILKGDMSFVGPRPTLENETALTRARERENAYSVRPGLTGLAQIRGRDELLPDEKAYLDGVYVRNMSLYYDFRIVLGTVFAVVNAEGYQEGGDE